MVSTAEYVDNPLPMPDANTVLPPPPQPFDPSLNQAVTPETAPQSAQAFAQDLQATNPVVQSVPLDTPINGPMPSPGITAEPVAAPVMPGVIQPAGEVATANTEANSNYLGQNPAMQDQLYPDPSAYHIPGM